MGKAMAAPAVWTSNPPERNRMLAVLSEQGYSDTELGAAYGVSRQAVAQVLRTLGVPPRPRKRACPARGDARAALRLLPPGIASRLPVRAVSASLSERMMDCVGQWPSTELPKTSMVRLAAMAAGLLRTWRLAGSPAEGAEAARVLSLWPGGAVSAEAHHMENTALARRVYGAWFDARRDALAPRWEAARVAVAVDARQRAGAQNG
jgi:hypothetical protein